MLKEPHFLDELITKEWCSFLTAYTGDLFIVVKVCVEPATLFT